MNKLRAIVLLLMMSAVGFFAFATTAPYNADEEARFAALEAGTSLAADSVTEDQLADIDSDGLQARRIARATYDVAVDGGTVAAHGLGVTLPAASLIEKSWFYVVTQFVDGGSGTVALHCEDADNILTAADITGNADGAIVAGNQSDGAVGNMTAAIASACEITATVAGSAQTAGKLILFVEYSIVE